MPGMEKPRLQLSAGMRRLLDYPKFASATRVLVLETGYFFDGVWRRAARQLGWECAAVPSAMVGGIAREEIAALFKTIAEFRPDFLLTSNFAGMDALGLFGRFFEDARLPYVSWFTDPPHMIIFGRDLHLSHYVVAATWERAYTPRYRELGFQHVHFMPHAADAALLERPPARDCARALAFVGASMIEQTEEAVEKHADAPELVEAVTRALDEGRINRATYVQGLDAMLPGTRLAGLDATGRRNLELLINYEATRRQREALARTLAPLGLEVRGDAHWRRIHPRCGGAVDFFRDLPDFYAGTAVNVNNTSLQMRDAVNQRVFDCPAAGGFLLTDAQPDMDAFFEPGREAAAYGSLEELRDKAAYYAARPEARRAIVTAARARIAAEHTHAHRLLALERFLKARFA